MCLCDNKKDDNDSDDDEGVCEKNNETRRIKQTKKRSFLHGLSTNVMPESPVASGIVVDADNVAGHRLKTP